MFGDLVVRAIGAILRALPLYVASMAKAQPGEASLGPMIATAGAVLANMGGNLRLGRSLRAAATDENPRQAQQVLVATALPLVLADAPIIAPGTTLAQAMTGLVRATERALNAEHLEQDAQTTVVDPATGRRVAARKGVSLDSESAPDAGSGGAGGSLDARHLGLFDPYQEVTAVHRVLEEAAQDAVLLAAKLSSRERQIMALDRLGYPPRDIAARLRTTANSVSALKHHAKQNISRACRSAKG